MTDEFNNREYVALLLRKVLIGALTVGEAVKNFPFDTGDKSIEAAYHALVHYEADEDLRHRDIMYREEQDEYIEMISETLERGENLPDNIIRNYEKYYPEANVPHRHDRAGAVKSFLRFLNIK